VDHGLQVGKKQDLRLSVSGGAEKYGVMDDEIRRKENVGKECARKDGAGLRRR